MIVLIICIIPFWNHELCVMYLCNLKGAMLVATIMQKWRLLLSLERYFELPIYAEQMTLAFVEFGCCKRIKRSHVYALNLLDYIDASALEDREPFYLPTMRIPQPS